jgi:hypothetical protein
MALPRLLRLQRHPAPAIRPTNRMAIASMVLGILWICTSTVARLDIRHLRDRRMHSEIEPGVSQASLVAILHAPKTVHTTSQATITATAIAVDSCSKYDESRSPAGPFTIP